jgi:hypothetical protein
VVVDVKSKAKGALSFGTCVFLIPCNLMSGDDCILLLNFSRDKIKNTIGIKGSTVLMPLLLYPSLTLPGTSIFDPFR